MHNPLAAPNREAGQEHDEHDQNDGGILPSRSGEIHPEQADAKDEPRGDPRDQIIRFPPS